MLFQTLTETNLSPSHTCRLYCCYSGAYPHFLNWTNASDSWLVSCPASPTSATCLHSVARVRHPSNTQIWSSYPVPLHPHTTRKAPTGYAMLPITCRINSTVFFMVFNPFFIFWPLPVCSSCINPPCLQIFYLPNSEQSFPISISIPFSLFYLWHLHSWPACL